MIDEKALVLIKAAMIMLNTYMDLMGSASLLESAAYLVGKEKVEDLIYELAEAHELSGPEIRKAKAELVLSRMRGNQSIKEKN